MRMSDWSSDVCSSDLARLAARQPLMSDVRVIARDRRDRLGEGPLWSARQDSLFWVDILGRRINRMALADGRVESFEQPHYAAWIIEREAGGFVAGIGRDIVRIDLDADVREAIVSVDPRKIGRAHV